MKYPKLIFLLSILLILLIIFLAQNTKQIQIGKITSIEYSENKITIELKNFKERLIIFNTNTINLKNGDTISFQGKSELYKNEKQIIVDKIWKFFI